MSAWGVREKFYSDRSSGGNTGPDVREPSRVALGANGRGGAGRLFPSGTESGNGDTPSCFQCTLKTFPYTLSKGQKQQISSDKPYWLHGFVTIITRRVANGLLATAHN